jgi:lincosamide nucleotidyltransferase A/C/D/E
MAEVTAAAVVGLIRGMDAAGIEFCLDGGWAVDALLGELTRPHGDLDIILDERQVPALRALLVGDGFEPQPGDASSNPVFLDRSGLKVDVHVVHFEPDGTAVHRMEDDRDWVFPASAFAGRGTIEGTVVRCLSAEAQVQCHAQGYLPTAKDYQDMERLRARFGVELPARLRRGAKASPESRRPRGSDHRLSSG